MSETLKVVVDRPDATVAVLRTDGYINNTGGEEIAKEAYALLGSGVNRLLLDLEKTKIVNSIGISILIEILEKLLDQGGKLAFCRLAPGRVRVARRFPPPGRMRARRSSPRTKRLRRSTLFPTASGSFSES